jgi:hypothetical protein
MSGHGWYQGKIKIRTENVAPYIGPTLRVQKSWDSREIPLVEVLSIFSRLIFQKCHSALFRLC